MGGEAIAFKMIYDCFHNNEIVLIDKARFNQSKFFIILNPLYFTYKLFFSLFRSHTIYITAGSNTFGKVRDIFVAYLSKIFSIKVICHVHGSAYLDLKFTELDKLLKRALKSFDKIILLSTTFIKYFSYIEKGRIYIVPNVIPPNCPELELNEKIRIIKNNELNLVFLSHLLPSKGLFSVLEALLLLKEEIPFKLHFAGEIIEEQNYSRKEIIRKLDFFKSILQDKFIIHGYLSGDRKWELLKNSHILCLPTEFHSEGLPISIIEGMYFGNAIIASNWRGIPDLVENELNGYLISPSDISEIANKIKLLNSNRQLLIKIATMNHNKISKNYNQVQFVKKVKELIIK